ncbi:catalase [Actinokineospora sp. NBRC 105648]|uniref:catalase n=1 Tax=Actinokineospora sp. NBRC 105648 TaxID=3032206 RepID=UPI0024A028FD|nr:catalase [Actinokineospora sp. NBRC 105648]GLZ40531.1 catalase [Actinokineospora sp. NBRC 105648]
MDAFTPARIVKDALEKAAERVADLVTPPVPGAPGSAPPELDPPTEPQGPLPRKPDQASPDTRTATGAETGAGPEAREQQGAYLTTATGTRLHDTDHSLKAGARGPTLLQDHHLREKITHFDHERIPERVVHARGAGVHGVFVGYGNAAQVCKAGFLAEGATTPAFVRFSTVVGSRGSADTVRDTRGFAAKLYTSEGNFDLVGNNIPVFFIQDGIKFPDIIHAAKPHPDREIPQAQSAHDTFWDFVSQHTEATHHVLWQMSDRAVPRSYRMMEGFGVHTFRLVNAEGGTTLAKFHWKPRLGVHSLLWEEAQLISGIDPDFHRRDLFDAIEAGAFPQWELGIQVLPDTPEQTFEGIDLLDPTKLVPEELAPVQPVGMLTLNRNTTNYFAETEQVAFHTGHLPPGIDVTDDPLLHARLFSYLDTQLSRLAGPNFNQIPVNRPHAPVNDMLRDGAHQHAVHSGVAPYKPNTLDGGCPFQAGIDAGAFVDVAATVAASVKERRSPATFADHFSQASLFYRSLTAVERDHVIRAFTFELGKCYEQVIKERQLRVLANVDTELCAQVAKGLGLPAPEATEPPLEVVPSPALSQLGNAWPTDGRVIGIVVDADDPDSLSALHALRRTITSADMTPLVIAARGGELADGLVAQRTFLTARSVEFDTILLAAAPPPAPDALPSLDDRAGAPAATVDPRVVLMLQEAYRHGKAIGAWGGGEAALLEARVPPGAPGVVVGNDPDDVFTEVTRLLTLHRVWERFTAPAR